MKRTQRKLHVLLWLILTPLVLIGFAMGIASRIEMPAQDPPVVEDLPESNPPATEVTGQ